MHVPRRGAAPFAQRTGRTRWQKPKAALAPSPSHTHAHAPVFRRAQTRWCNRTGFCLSCGIPVFESYGETDNVWKVPGQGKRKGMRERRQRPSRTNEKQTRNKQRVQRCRVVGKKKGAQLCACAFPCTTRSATSFFLIQLRDSKKDLHVCERKKRDGVCR